MNLIHEALIDVKKAVGAIAKDRSNAQQGFKFRGIDDIENALHHALIEAGVSVVPVIQSFERHEAPTKNGGVATSVFVTVEHHFFAADGSSIVAATLGEGRDSGDKATAKAMTMARKTALLQVFGIPTDEEDPEAGGEPTDAPDWRARARVLIDARPKSERAEYIAGVLGYKPDSFATMTDEECRQFVELAGGAK